MSESTLPAEQARFADPLSAFADGSFAGRTVFVTGASSGLGRASAIALAAKGARLVVSGRSEERLEETRRALQGEGHAAVAGELADADAAQELIKAAAKEHGPFHGIFHSAGVFNVLPAKVTKQRHIDELFGASVPGAYGIARAASQKSLMVDGGAIVLMSSVAGVRGNAGLTAYAGAKAAILGLTAALAVELAPRHIRVNAIVAGTVETEMHLRMQSAASGQQTDANLLKHPLGYGRPDDIAAAVLYLMSDAARWVTGTAMVVDGGYLA
ncbi:MAG TPA: SDR family NAD(P)-dependent oxidoreductase [Allosphingosinicella sp.]|jgi:NAD(P)-dependent dehydrogenase (short-subunit alcohol dehydrogenase family)